MHQTGIILSISLKWSAVLRHAMKCSVCYSHFRRVLWRLNDDFISFVGYPFSLQWVRTLFWQRQKLNWNLLIYEAYFAKIKRKTILFLVASLLQSLLEVLLEVFRRVWWMSTLLSLKCSRPHLSTMALPVVSVRLPRPWTSMFNFYLVTFFLNVVSHPGWHPGSLYWTFVWMPANVTQFVLPHIFGNVLMLPLLQTKSWLFCFFQASSPSLCPCRQLRWAHIRQAGGGPLCGASDQPDKGNKAAHNRLMKYLAWEIQMNKCKGMWNGPVGGAARVHTLLPLCWKNTL